MSTVGQQRSALQELVNRLTPSNLKRAIAGLRPSEAEHFLQMLRDAVHSLARTPELPQPKKEDHQW